MDFLVTDEISKLKSVIIGIAEDSGNVKSISELYDPISISNFKNGLYPSQNAMIGELNNFAES
jgi:hypothetical protein